MICVKSGTREELVGKEFFWGINRAIHDGRFNTIEMICPKILRVSVR